MSGQINRKKAGSSNRIIKSKELEKAYAGGKLRGSSQVNLSTGMPGVVGLVRNTLNNKLYSVPFREGFLISMDSNKSLMNSIQPFFDTYYWRYKVTFEDDILLAIKEGALSKDIRSKLPNLFPKIAETEKRSQELAKVRKLYEKTLQRKKDLSAVELFSAWVLKNWDYMSGNKYIHKGIPPENGLFFFEPETPVNSTTDLINYFQELYVEFRGSLNRLRVFGGTEGGASATHPTIMYQQLMRWIALDSQTKVRGKRLSAHKDFLVLSILPETLKELKQLINKEKFSRIRSGKLVVWKKNEIWKGIKRHLEEHPIPQVNDEFRIPD